jgi:ATP-dependent Lon protease
LEASSSPAAVAAPGGQPANYASSEVPVQTMNVPVAPAAIGLFEGHREYLENQRGVSFDKMILPYLAGATEIVITDPYIRIYHQMRNLMELVGFIAAEKLPEDEITLRVITIEHDEVEKAKSQISHLIAIREAAALAGIVIEVAFDKSKTIHDRSIETDTGWKILLGRGLDIFQHVPTDTFDLSTRTQQFRPVKGFGVTYLRVN